MPRSITVAAVLLFLSAALNLMVGWWAYSALWTCTGAILGAPCGGLGIFAGILGYLYLPLGMLELAAAVLTLLDPRTALRFLPLVSLLEVLFLFLGGLHTAMVGIVVLLCVQNEAVRAWRDAASDG